MSPLLTRLLTLVARLKAAGASAKEIGETIRAILHSPIIDVAVALTPNKLDDAILAELRLLFPAE